jgi:hypothetical protein
MSAARRCRPRAAHLACFLLAALAAVLPAVGRADDLALLPGVARGDDLAKLAADLNRLTATDEVRGTLEIQLSRQSMEEHWADQSRATVDVEDGPQGVRVGLARAGSRQALLELRAQTLDPSKHTPTYNALQALNLNEVAGDLDSAAALAQDVSLSHLVEVRAASYLGRPARLFVLALPPRLSAEARKHIRTAESRLSVWVGTDGVPLGAEKTEQTKGRFLVLFFESLRKQTWTYARRGNRLFAARHETSDTASGMGQDYRSSTVATLALR